MPCQKSAMPLASIIRRQLIWIGVAFAVSCIFITFSFAVYSVDQTANQLMHLEAESVVRQAKEAPDDALPQMRTLSAWNSWQAIPESIRQRFSSQDITPGEAIEVQVRSDTGDIEYLYLLHHEDPDYGALYLVSQFKADEVESVFVNLLSSVLLQSLGLTLLILTALFFLIAWLLRRVMEPLQLLSDWAVRLKHQQGTVIDVDFPITELNQIAEQLHQGVEHVRAVNEREQQFLKHASHELRTPLAVIQASLDTLSLQTEEDSPANRSVQRALKASSRMIQLSDTLLWLARETQKTIPKTRVETELLYAQLIDDHRYLLCSRAIEIRKSITVATLTIEAPLLSIVLANLIRNAFQHSSEGEILIELGEKGITISNPANTAPNDAEPGFGLGLQLVQRICQKLGWTFAFILEEHKARVVVNWA